MRIWIAIALLTLTTAAPAQLPVLASGTVVAPGFAAGTRTQPIGASISASTELVAASAGARAWVTLTISEQDTDINLDVWASRNPNGPATRAEANFDVRYTSPTPIEVDLSMAIASQATTSCPRPPLIASVELVGAGGLTHPSPVYVTFFRRVRIDATGIVVRFRCTMDLSGPACPGSQGESMGALLRLSLDPVDCSTSIGSPCSVGTSSRLFLDASTSWAHPLDTTIRWGSTLRFDVLFIGLSPAPVPTPFGCPLQTNPIAAVPLPGFPNELQVPRSLGPLILQAGTWDTFRPQLRLSNALLLNCP